MWSAGPTRTPLGQHHPVVVRSLERYTDSWVIGAWRQRWQHLRRDPQRAAAGTATRPEPGLGSRPRRTTRSAGSPGPGCTAGPPRLT
ncbi:hypothetical protein [Streptomyces sp. NPDC008139]|uniref:VMAP-C domain-containing protein n=1 Tax=Streptomyces sp. NPDC008139 TaxID=3364814 RepID=UPI0036E5B2B5